MHKFWRIKVPKIPIREDPKDPLAGYRSKRPKVELTKEERELKEAEEFLLED